MAKLLNKSIALESRDIVSMLPTAAVHCVPLTRIDKIGRDFKELLAYDCGLGTGFTQLWSGIIITTPEN